MAAKGLLDLDPTNTEAMDRASCAYNLLGESELRLGRRNAAKSALITAVNLSDKLVSSDGSVALWKGKNRADAKLMLARHAASTGDIDSARAIYRDIETELRELVSSQHADPIILRRYLAALAGTARITNTSKDAWDEIIQRAGQDPKRNGPEALTILAEAYQRSGKNGEARRIVTKLYAAGYRHPDFLALIDEFPALRIAIGKPVHATDAPERD